MLYNNASARTSSGLFRILNIRKEIAIISISTGEATELLQGTINTVIYAVIGIIAFVFAYFVVDLVNKKFNFNEALKEKNEAAGIMIFGIFIGIAFIVSGVIQ